MTLSTELARLAEAATPGPWELCFYDAGDREHYDHNGPCPSIQAPESEDCAVVHWDGFKQRYWSSANGNQRQIEANAALIVALRNNLPAIIAALKAAETPLPDDMAGLVERLRNYAKDWRDRAASQEIVIEAADTITALTRQLDICEANAKASSDLAVAVSELLAQTRAERDAEVKRLREALEALVDGDDTSTLDDRYENARQALGGDNG